MLKLSASLGWAPMSALRSNLLATRWGWRATISCSKKLPAHAPQLCSRTYLARRCALSMSPASFASLIEQGDTAMVGFAVDWLAHLYGSQVTQAVKRPI